MTYNINGRNTKTLNTKGDSLPEVRGYIQKVFRYFNATYKIEVFRYFNATYEIGVFRYFNATYKIEVFRYFNANL